MAPATGTVHGIARDDIAVPAGAKMLEMDPPSLEHARFSGFGERPRRIAVGMVNALAARRFPTTLGGHRGFPA
jgi:hypothetical protein